MLTWNVCYGSFNERKIKTFNIFEHADFYEDVKKAAKKCKNDRDAFAKEVRHSLMYFFWAKCEWEIVLQSWPPGDNFRDEKVDVFDQVMLNWDRFIDYVWEHKKEI